MENTIRTAVTFISASTYHVMQMKSLAKQANRFNRNKHPGHKTTEQHLLRLQVTDDSVDAVQNLINEWHYLPDLNLNKMTTAFLCYFYERVACHVLNTIVGLCTKQ